MLDAYKTRDYAYFRTSPEILAAIDAISNDDVRDPDGPAWRIWENNEREADILDYINAQHWKAPSLQWCSTAWAVHNGVAFVRSAYHHVVVHKGRGIRFDCLNDASLARARSTITKEPGTIAWIDEFEIGSTFWDIGANIGTFSLYAAIIRGCQVTAFEPVAANFSAINRNIIANSIDTKVRALPIALDEECKVSDMRMRDAEEASALHVFGSATDYTGAEFKPSHLQGALGLSIDALTTTFGLPVPNYVKIDVDGLERAVVSGGKSTFANSQCRSVLVELDLNDPKEVKDITDIMNACGLHRDDTVTGNIGRAHGAVMVYNMIFRR